TDSYAYTDLDANKAYTVIAVAMGTLGTTNGAVAKYNFQTAELTPESSEDITLTNARMIDACEADGWWQMIAANADTTTYLTISPNEATAVAGNYSIDDMDADYTYIALNKQDKYKFATLDVEVAVDGETFTLTGTGIAMNAVEYHFNITGNVSLYQASGVAPAKIAPAKKEAKLCKKGNLEKSAKRSEKLLNR
ncbi:MAG: lipoprotein LpqH, partial [Paludibacteraceae bacterium]|nr:lipoprotein LpqH [Paludibacteraceae bacterium]